MRLVFTLLLAVLALGCRTHKRAPAVPTGPVTEAEARSIADVYIVMARGACGSGAGRVEDGGEFWRVHTVFGLGARPAPYILIDKRTRHVTVAETEQRQ
jgi:hypothetical protein